MTSTFDGSTNNTGTGGPPTAVAAPLPEAEQPTSLLDQLRDEVEQRDEGQAELWKHRIKGTSFRLVCDPDIDYADFQRWQKLAIKKTRGGRRGGQANFTDLDQFTLSAAALVGANVRLDVLVRGTSGDEDEHWRPVTLPGDSEPMAIDHRQLLGTFNTPDPIALLRKLFGRDAAVIDAGQELLAAAGYMGDDEDTEDPTGSLRSAGSARKG